MATTDFTTQITNAFNAIHRAAPAASDISSWNTTLNNGVTTVANMITSLSNDSIGQITQGVTALYQAAFNRAPDTGGLTYWVQQIQANGNSIYAIGQAFLTSQEAVNLYGSPTSNSLSFVTALYTQVLGRTPSSSELAYYTSGTGNTSPGLTLTHFAQSPEATTNFASAMTTFLNAAAGGSTTVYTTSTLKAVFYNTSTGATGLNYSLTTGVDNLTGTAGNDTFTADNTAGAGKYTLSAADSVNGNGGTDTLKIYSDGLAGGTTFTPANITNIASLYVNNLGGTATTLIGLDVSAIVGLTSLTIDTPTATTLTGDASATITLAGQSLTIQNIAASVTSTPKKFTYVVASTTDTTENITLNNDLQTNTTTGAITIDVTGAKVTSETITGIGTKSAVDLANSTGAAITTLNLAGSAALSLTESGAMAAAVKTINASTDTGGVTVDASLGTQATTFTFTGGSGVNSLSLTKTSLESLVSGSQLNGGTGTSNTLVITDAAYAFVTADYTALNKTTNFQILGLTGADTVDASKLTSITHFQDKAGGAATTTINNAQSGTILDITAGAAATAINTITAAIGVNTLSVNQGIAGTGGTAGITDTLNTTGFTTVNFVSQGTGVGTNTIVFGNADNTLFNVTGAQNLTVTSIAATTTGSKLDAHAFTGTLIVTADSGVGDVFLTGSGTTNITGKAAAAAAYDTVTYLSGHTKVDTLTSATAAVSATKYDVVTNYVLGQDVLSSSAGALTVGAVTVGSAPTLGVVTETTAAQFLADAWAATGVAQKAEIWYDTANNNTWVVEFQAGSANSSHVVELVGVHATAISTTAGTAGAVIIA